MNATTDFSAGRFIWSPSAEILGGGSRTRQAYERKTRLVTLAPTAIYDATTTARWQDVGAKVGLAVSAPLTPMIDFGFGGTLAAVYRHATLKGNDQLDDGFGFVTTSAVNFSRSTVAFIPGAQAQVTVRPTSTVQMRVFGEVQRDNRVPGIVSPTFTADQFFPFFIAGTPATPASIGFTSQTNYHAGGGVTVTFPP